MSKLISLIESLGTRAYPAMAGLLIGIIFLIMSLIILIRENTTGDNKYQKYSSLPVNHDEEDQPTVLETAENNPGDDEKIHDGETDLIDDDHTKVVFAQEQYAQVTLIETEHTENIHSFAVPPEAVLGRGTDSATVSFPHEMSMSNRHCRLYFENGNVMVEDLGSTNKTRINNKILTVPAELKTGDILQTGSLSMRVKIDLNH